MDPVDDIALKPGVTAYVDILVETVENRLALPVQAIYPKGGRRYVFKADDGEAVPVEVQLGAIGTEWAEVRGGLSDNEKILLAFSDEHKRLAPDLPPDEQSALETMTAGALRANGIASPVSDSSRDGDNVSTQHRGRSRRDGDDRGGNENASQRRGGSHGQWLTRLMKRDANGDGMIQKDELPAEMSGMFDRLDANGDGALDRKELAVAVNRGRSDHSPGSESDRQPGQGS